MRPLIPGCAGPSPRPCGEKVAESDVVLARRMQARARAGLLSDLRVRPLIPGCAGPSPRPSGGGEKVAESDVVLARRMQARARAGLLSDLRVRPLIPGCAGPSPRPRTGGEKVAESDVVLARRMQARAASRAGAATRTCARSARAASLQGMACALCMWGSGWRVARVVAMRGAYSGGTAMQGRRGDFARMSTQLRANVDMRGGGDEVPKRRRDEVRRQEGGKRRSVEAMMRGRRHCIDVLEDSDIDGTGKARSCLSARGGLKGRRARSSSQSLG